MKFHQLCLAVLVTSVKGPSNLAFAASSGNINNNQLSNALDTGQVNALTISDNKGKKRSGEHKSTQQAEHPSPEHKKKQPQPTIELYRLCNEKDTGNNKTVEASIQYIEKNGIKPLDPGSEGTVYEHVMSIRKGKYVSFTYSPKSIIRFAKSAVENHNAKEEELIVTKINVQVSDEDYIDLSNNQSELTMKHRAEINSDPQAIRYVSSMREVLFERQIWPSEIDEVLSLSEFVEMMDEDDLLNAHTHDQVVKQDLPSYAPPDGIGTKTDVEVNNNVEFMGECYNKAHDGTATSTHWKGFDNAMENINNSSNDDGTPTVEVLKFAQSGIPQAVIDWINAPGFDIRNCTRDQLDELKRNLPANNWSIEDGDLDGTKNQFNKWVGYLKVSCRLKHEHVVTCNVILKDSGATSRDKGIAKQVLSDMEGKENDEYHCVWYVGESGDFLRRMKQGYPEILERFGVTDRIQVGQGGYTSGSSYKDQILLQESVVGAMIEGAINKTLRQGLAEGETMKYLSFYKLSSTNLVHGGQQGDVNDYGVSQWCKMSYSGNADKLVSKLNPPQCVLEFIDQYQVVIQLANNLVIRDFFQPTVRQLCVGWGTLMKELGKGIFDKTKMPKAKTTYKDKNGNVIKEVGEYYDNWGQVCAHTSTGICMTAKLVHMAVVIEREHLGGQLISEMKSLDEDLDFEDENDNDDFKFLKKEYGSELLKKLQDTRLNHYTFEGNGFRCLTASLHTQCTNKHTTDCIINNKYISDLDSLDGYFTADTVGSDTAETKKYYNSLSQKYNDEELLEKIKAVYNKKCNETREIELELKSVTESFGFRPTILIEENPFIIEVAAGGVAEREGVEEGMEIKSINGENVEGIGEPVGKLMVKLRAAKQGRYLKLEVFKYVNYRKPK